MFDAYGYDRTYSTRDSMTPEEALGYLAKNSVILPIDTLDVLRAVFDAGAEHQGANSCGCC